jgi:hypothetical protein
VCHSPQLGEGSDTPGTPGPSEPVLLLVWAAFQLKRRTSVRPLTARTGNVGQPDRALWEAERTLEVWPLPAQEPVGAIGGIWDRVCATLYPR